MLALESAYVTWNINEPTFINFQRGLGEFTTACQSLTETSSADLKNSADFRQNESNGKTKRKNYKFLLRD